MAKNAIRYYSKFGHTKKMVEAVKDIVGARPAFQLAVECQSLG